MLSSSLFNEQNKQLKDLKFILARYQDLASSDPHILRLLIPSNDIWRFFVDGQDQQEGNSWVSYESRESGYLRALQKAFDTLFEVNKQTELNTEFIKQLHALATAHVDMQLFQEEEKDHSEFRRSDNIIDAGMHVDLDANNGLSQEGIKQLLKQTTEYSYLSIIDNPNQGRLHAFRLYSKNIDTLRSLAKKVSGLPKDVREMVYGDSVIAFASKQMSSKSDAIAIYPLLKKIGLTNDDDELANVILANIEPYGHAYTLILRTHHLTNLFSYLQQRMKEYIARYQELIQQKNPLLKLYAIAQFIQSCEQLHPFRDGNTRTFSMLLLNKLLMQNGFPPAYQYDPNRCLGIALHEMVDDIIEGMHASLQLAQNKLLYSGTQTSDIAIPNDNLNNYFAELTEQEEEKRERPVKKCKFK